MTQDELYNYLGYINADDEFIQNIVAHQIDGQQWGAMFTTGDNQVVEGDEWKATIDAFTSEKTPNIVKIKVKTHLTLTLQSLKLSSKADEREQKEAASYSIKDLYSMRLPELPAGDGAGGRLFVKQVKAYKELYHP